MQNEEQPREKPAFDAESEIWNAIAAFEKILEAMPTDRVSLEALAEAYEQVGDRARAKEYFLRLAKVLVKESDDDAAQDLLRKLLEFGADDPEVEKAIAEIENIKPEKIMADVFEEEQRLAKPKASSISDEIAFAWNLLQEGKLDKDEYSSVVHDLSENSSKTTGIPVSTLHVLSDRNFSNLNEIMGFVSKNCAIPIISLPNFEFQPATASILPMEFIVQRKIIVFDMVGKDAMAAILNPYDVELPDDFNQLAGMRGHFFLVLPTEFDSLLEHVKKTLQGDENKP